MNDTNNITKTPNKIENNTPHMVKKYSASKTLF